MGTTTREISFARCGSEPELFKRWKEAQSESSYETGHEAYSGSLANAELTVSRHAPFATAEAASKHAWLEENEPYKRRAIAYRYGDPAKVFPCTVKDKALDLACTNLAQELQLFERNVLLRFLDSKSASKKCAHCDSVISKKSREPMRRENFLKQLNQFQGFERRDYVQEQTSCPACQRNLLMTDTDIKRRESLAKRADDAASKRQAAYNEFTAKAPDYGYVVIASVPE